MKKNKNRTLSAIGVALQFVSEHKEQFEDGARSKGILNLNKDILTSNSIESGVVDE